VVGVHVAQLDGNHPANRVAVILNMSKPPTQTLANIYTRAPPNTSKDSSQRPIRLDILTHSHVSVLGNVLFATLLQLVNVARHQRLALVTQSIHDY
jgi:hypothetical protein